MSITDTTQINYIHIWNTEGWYKVYLRNIYGRCNRRFKTLEESLDYIREHRRFTIHLHREDGRVIDKIRLEPTKVIKKRNR